MCDFPFRLDTAAPSILRGLGGSPEAANEEKPSDYRGCECATDRVTRSHAKLSGIRVQDYVSEIV